MASKPKVLTRQKLVSELADRLEMHGLKRWITKLAPDGYGSTYSRVATWKSVEQFDIYAFFGDYIGTGQVFWIGFGSHSLEPINKILNLYDREQITLIVESDWDHNLTDKNSDIHKGLLKEQNVVFEDYRATEAPYAWIGRVLRINQQTLARSQQFILEILQQLEPIVFSAENVIEWVGPTQKEATVKVRLAQNAFRKKLEQHWGSCCAVTGSRLSATLRASHIVPWAESNDTEKVNVDNGLLLIAQLDALFDRGFISFDDDGVIIISPSLNRDDISFHGLHEHLRLRRPPSEKQKTFLRRHQLKHLAILTKPKAIQ